MPTKCVASSAFFCSLRLVLRPDYLDAAGTHERWGGQLVRRRNEGQHLVPHREAWCSSPTAVNSENLPVKTYVYELSSEERVCPGCGVERKEIGSMSARSMRAPIVRGKEKIRRSTKGRGLVEPHLLSL